LLAKRNKSITAYESDMVSNATQPVLVDCDIS